MENERDNHTREARFQLAKQYEKAAQQFDVTLKDFEKSRRRFGLNFWIALLMILPILFPIIAYFSSGIDWTPADWLLNSLIFSTGVFLESVALFLFYTTKITISVVVSSVNLTTR